MRHDTLIRSILLFCKVYLLRLHVQHIILMRGMALLYEASCSSVKYIYYDCVCSILLLCEAPCSYMKHICYSVKYIYIADEQNVSFFSGDVCVDTCMYVYVFVFHSRRPEKGYVPSASCYLEFIHYFIYIYIFKGPWT